MKTKTILIPVIFLAVLMLCSGAALAKAVPAKAAAALFNPANFVLIRGGEFTMGSPEGEVDRRSNEALHQVRVSNFLMSRYSVTVAEFRKFVKASGYQTDAEKGGFSDIGSNAKNKKEGVINWRCGASGSVRPLSEENHPVVHVSWNDAVAYCRWISSKTGKRFRLPTEAEREYACRADSRTSFNTGENVTTDQANYNGNNPYNNNPKGIYRENTVPVNSFAPNAWGLYNMHGNVWEWCSDWFSGTYYGECKASGMVKNPAGPATGSGRVLRGGSWGGDAGSCRSANRSGGISDGHDDDVGFRIVFVP